MAYQMLPPREYRTLKALRRGEVVDLDGIRLVMDGDGKVRQPGDLYIAERNTGPKLLVVKSVTMAPCDCCVAWVNPTTTDYNFDGPECVRVRETEECE